MLKQSSVIRLLFGVLLLTQACGSKGNSGNPSSYDGCDIVSHQGSANPSFVAGAGIFSFSPIDVSNISNISPLGNLVAPGHTFGSDHVYFNMVDQTALAHSVYAAASGTVVNIYSPDNNTTAFRIVVSIDTSFQYYVDHVKPLDSVTVGSTVTAGQVIAMNSGGSQAVDFGVYNFNNTSYPGILDACIQEAERFTDAPLRFFSGSLSTTLYGKVNTTSTNKDGTIGFDIAGKLVGDWVLQSATNAEASTENQLTLAYDTKTENTMHISSGGAMMPVGDYGVSGGDPDFATISAASGTVTYHVAGQNSAPSGVLLVQMTDESTVKLEFFAGVSSANFDGNFFTFIR